MIGAGVGYLAGAALVLAGWVWWLRRGRALSDGFAEDLVTRASNAPRGRRWTYVHWSSQRTRTATAQGRTGFWMWLPLVLFLPVLCAVFLASAVVEFAR